MSSSSGNNNSAAVAQANNGNSINSGSSNNKDNKTNKPPNSNEAGHYVVTAHRPGGVIVSTRCSFLGPNSVDVVIAKSRRLEVRQLSRSSPSTSTSPNNASSMDIDQQQQQSPTFSLVLSAPINGRIISLVPFRHPSSQTDYIFFLTENKRYAVISYSPSSSSSSSLVAAGTGTGALTAMTATASGSGNNVHNLITHASGDLSDYGLAIRGNEPEHGPIATIEPNHKCIVLHLYEGYVTVLPIHLSYRYKPQQQQQQQKFGMRAAAGTATADARGVDFMGPAFHCRVEERDIFCMEFLQLSDVHVGSNNHSNTAKCMPQLALLHQDSRGLQHVIAHSLDLKQKQLIAYGAQNNNSSSSKSSSTASKSSSKGTTSAEAGGGGGGTLSRSSSGGRTLHNLYPPPLHQRLKKSRVEGGSGIIISIPPPNPNTNNNDSSSTYSNSNMGNSSSVNPATGASTATTKIGGILILGHRKITYHNTAENITKVLPISPCLFESYVEVHSSSLSSSGTNGEDANGQTKSSVNKSHDSTLRYLLGDDLGRIHILALLRNEHGNVSELHIDTLGEANVSTCLVYLDHGLLFLGSQYTDSQLIQILDQPVEATSSSMVSFENESNDYGHGFHDDILLHGKKLTYLSVVDEYVNLGPIVDFDLVPTTHSVVEGESNHSSALQKRQSMAITASGAGKDGSLRLVSNGIGMTEHAAVELAGIKGMWSIRRSFNDLDDAFLIQSYVGETRILGVAVETEGEESDMDDVDDSSSIGATLEEVEIPGIDAGSSTLYAGNIASDSGNSSSSLVLQITESKVQVIDMEMGVVKSSWSPSSVSALTGGSITVAAANQSGQVVLALGGGVLVYLRVIFGNVLKVEFLGQTKLDQEISCLNLNPFDSDSGYLDSMEDGDSSMEVDEGTINERRNQVLVSTIVAVGLWDDFHVRILSLNEVEVLKEIDRVNIAPDVNSYKGSENYFRQHLIARSLCFVTLKSTANGAAAKGSHALSLDNRVDMLLVGLGDGGLVSFVVNTEAENSDGPPCSIHSRKEVSLGTRAINLIPFHNHTTDKGTCVLATGDRPTVIYLASGGGSNKIPKLCYSNINLETDSEEVEDEEHLSRARFERLVVNVATPFHSSVLFSTSNTLDKNYSLCLSNESTLRLGIIDDIQKLHVTTHKLGMAPRRVTYHESGRVVCVGCIDDGSGNFDPIARNNTNNKGNCIRFFDDTTFEEFNRLDLEPFEMILSMMSVQLKVNKDDVNIPIEGDAAPRKNSADSEHDEETFRSFLVVGTAFSYPDDDEPSKGRILLIHCDIRGGIVPTSQSNPSRSAVIVTEVHVSGGVYSICPFYNGTILATINAKTHLCKLSGYGPGSDGKFDLKIDNAGHRGHILSLLVKSLAGAENNTTSKKQEQIAIVGDLARSISVVKFYPEYGTLEEIARDFNQNWLTAIEMLSQNVYLGGENFHNLFVLRRNPNAESEEIRSRLDTIGLFNLGEMVNKFIRGSLVIPNNSSNNSSSDVVNHSSDSNGGDSLKSQNGKSVMNIGSQTLYGTIDGTIGSIIGLDIQTATFLSSLERAMTRVITPVGNLKHNDFRAFRGQRCQQGSRGFVDGDLVESFVDLDRKTMELVVKEMRSEGKWKFKSDESLPLEMGNNGDEEMKEAQYGEKAPGLNVSDVITMVEEISMLH